MADQVCETTVCCFIQTIWQTVELPKNALCNQLMMQAHIREIDHTDMMW